MEPDMSSWTDLLHSSTKLLEQAAPSAQFPPLQRNLDQLEALSNKLKAKTLRTEVPAQSIAATRSLAREGLNAEQLAQDLKSFELKTTFEDVFPAEATGVEEYLQQKKAQMAGLEDEVKNLRAINQQLLQEKVVLEAENSSLKKLIHILKETLDFGLGFCPLNKHASTSLQDCRVPPICATNIPCLHPCVGSSSQAGIGGSTKMNKLISGKESANLLL